MYEIEDHQYQLPLYQLTLIIISDCFGDSTKWSSTEADAMFPTIGRILRRITSYFKQQMPFKTVVKSIGAGATTGSWIGVDFSSLV